MNRYYSVQFFAQTYGNGAYGACTYQSATVCSTSAGGGSSSGSGGLVNTGFMVLVIVTLACLLIFVALFVRFWRRRKLTPQSMPLKAGEDNER